MTPPRVFDLRLKKFTPFGPWIPWDKPEEFRLDRATEIKDSRGNMIYENDLVRTTFNHWLGDHVSTQEHVVKFSNARFELSGIGMTEFDTLDII